MSLKALAGLIVALGTILGAAFAIDERYARAASVAKAQQSIERRVDRAVLQTQRWSIDDRLQTLEMVDPARRSNFERAQIERYKRELEKVDRELNSIPK